MQGGKRIMCGDGVVGLRIYRELDLADVRHQRNLVVTYLDHNATSPLLPQAREAWLNAVDQFPGNPSSPHRLGARADRAVDEASHRLASILGCQPRDVVWTSGATEACNTVLHHVAKTSDATASVWLSAIEHPAVAESAANYFPGRMRIIPVHRSGAVDVDWVATELARARPALVAIMAANNETGVLQPWREVRQLCALRNVPFFCDATQWCGRLSAQGLGACDFVAGSAHKFGGPRGVGFLKVPGGTPLTPLFSGGKQQERRRAGTENVPGVVASLATLEWCEQQLSTEGTSVRHQTRERFERALRAALPGVHVNGEGAGIERLWNTVSIIMPAADCRIRWVVKLDKAGFAVSTGSACASGSEEPSHVLTAMGLGPAEAARVLRFSGGWLTTETEWENLRATLERLFRELGS